MSYTVKPDVKLAGVSASTDPRDKMYEPKNKKKLVRVLTVVAYVFFVSLAAITLSLFYIFIYNPEKPATRLNTRSLYGNNTPQRLDDGKLVRCQGFVFILLKIMPYKLLLGITKKPF